jgi:hypothetical protein
MTDTSLSSLFPAVPVTVGGERLRLRPVVLGELPAVERVIEGWQVLVVTEGDPARAEAWTDFVDLCAAAVGRSRAWIDQLSETDFETLICLVLAANEDVWKPQPPKAGEEGYSWAKIIQCLVEHGHSFEAIQGYTLSQARALLGECFRMESEALAREIQAAAFSMASSESVEKAVKGLLRG